LHARYIFLIKRYIAVKNYVKIINFALMISYLLAGFVEERTVFSPMSHTFTVETHIPGAPLTPCKADTKGRLRSRTAHIIRIWIIAADLAKLQKHCTSSVNNSLVTDICDKLKSRNKLIRIADTSVGGWAIVREYEQNEIADNSDDEKKFYCLHL
jgi:hypothetical protein